MGWPKGAHKWSEAEICSDAIEAKALFRKRRLGEPKDSYLRAFELLEKANKKVIGLIPQILADPVDPTLIASVVSDEHLLTALRYLGAPPISADDLETLIDNSLASTRIAANPEHAKAVRDVIRHILDPKRFPWVYKNRKPTAQEKNAAILASSVVAATQRVQTARRSDEKALLEGAVKTLLVNMEFQQVSTRHNGIQVLRDAPSEGKFMTGCTIGEHNADIVVGLFDGRLLSLECKASNSEINSRKRINKEVAVDAKDWISKFGDQNIVSAAAIQGVFKPAYLIKAQETPVVFFWGHRLTDLKKFIESTRNP